MRAGVIIVTGNRPEALARLLDGPPDSSRVNGVDLCVDTAGDAADPAILLIGGMGSSMDWWDEEFCQRLAAGGRFVIRYDHRDTGRSVSYPAGAPGYTGADLAADAAGVLDAPGAERSPGRHSPWGAPSRSRLPWLIRSALTRWC